MTSLIEMCRDFLSDRSSLDDLRNWLAVNQWNLDAAEQELADAVDVAIVHLDDGYSENHEMRHRIKLALGTCVHSKYGITTIETELSINAAGTSSSATNEPVIVGGPPPYNPNVLRLEVSV